MRDVKLSVRKLGAIALLTLACSWPIFAQATYELEHREWAATGFAGASLLGSREFPTTVIGSDLESSRTVGVSYKSGYEIGVRGTQNVNEYWAADLEYSFANQFLRFNNLSPDIQNLSLELFLHHLTYDVSYLPLPRTSRFRPYVAAGAGAALFYLPGRVKKDAAELGLQLRDSWQLVFNWGGGAHYLVRDQFALTFDVKHRLSGVPSYGLPSSARVVNGQFQPGIASHGVLQNWQLNFGLSFQWDEY